MVCLKLLIIQKFNNRVVFSLNLKKFKSFLDDFHIQNFRKMTQSLKILGLVTGYPHEQDFSRGVNKALCSDQMQKLRNSYG